MLGKFNALHLQSKDIMVYSSSWSRSFCPMNSLILPLSMISLGTAKQDELYV